MNVEHDKILLILDLDETLIHATDEPLNHPYDFEVYSYYAYKRPYLDSFLKFCFENFHVGVWSSASDLYVQRVAETIIPDPSKLKFVWGRSRCTFRSHARFSADARYYEPAHLDYIKPLKKLKKYGWQLERMLIVDDTPAKCVKNFGNAIYPSEFEGAQDDDELVWLEKYLLTLKDKQNVRRIEKRNWRNKIILHSD